MAQELRGRRFMDGLRVINLWLVERPEAPELWRASGRASRFGHSQLQPPTSSLPSTRATPRPKAQATHARATLLRCIYTNMLDSAVRSFSPQQGRSADPSGNLRQSRNAVVEDAGWSIPLVSLHTFLSDILPTKVRHAPCETAGVAQRLLNRLTNDGTYSSEHDRWLAFPEDPKDTTDEGVVFVGLSNIAQAIDAAFKAEFNLGKRVKPTAQYEQEPDSSPEHIHRQNLTRPDGVFVLSNKKMASDRILWIDVVACGEFKRRNTISNLNDDVDKTLWSLHHIMREDPRRRFAYAFTVENRTMRLFYCDRSQYAVSQPFDFCSEPRYLIHFFVALMYASETDLGWDPTMKLVVIDDKPQYDLTVHDKHGKQSVYRTSELLSNISTFNLRGRGTRVWRAKRLMKGKVTGPDVAIRDNWIDDDREREADVTQHIINDVPRDESQGEGGEDHDPEHSKKWLREHLLHIATSGDVQIDGKTDRTRLIFSVNNFLIPQEDKSDKAVKKQVSRMDSLQSEVKNHHHDVHDMYPTPQQDTRKHSVKAHHRIVYEEVCITLNDVKNLDDALWYIQEASRILAVIHAAGWVHRDISGGNILIYDAGVNDGESETIVKIGDFEYAKKYDRDSKTEAHPIRTGTAAFMPVEVAALRYQFTPLPARPASVPAPVPNLPSRSFVTTGKIPTGNPAPPPRQSRVPRQQASRQPDVFSSPFKITTTGWRYNPLHDMESLWWLANFVVFDKDLVLVPRDPTIPIPLEFQESDDARRTRLLHQYRFSVPLFHHLNKDERSQMLRVPNYLTDAEDKLHPFLRGPLVNSLETLRVALVESYFRAERNVEAIDHTVAQPLYEVFYVQLYDATAVTRSAEFDAVIRSLGKTIRQENITDVNMTV